MDTVKNMTKALNQTFVSQISGLDEASKKMGISPLEFVLIAAEEKIATLSTQGPKK